MSKKNKKKTKKYARRKRELLKAQQSSGVGTANSTNTPLSVDEKLDQKSSVNSKKNKSGKTSKSVNIDKKENLNDKLIKKDLYKTFALTFIAFLMIFLVWKFGGKYLP